MKYNRNLVNSDHIIIMDENNVRILSIKERMENRVAVFSLQGELLNEIAYELEDEISAMLTVCTDVRIDLSGLDFIASKGIQVLLQAQKEIERKKGTLTLSGASEEVLEIFETNGFSELFVFEKGSDD